MVEAGDEFLIATTLTDPVHLSHLILVRLIIQTASPLLNLILVSYLSTLYFQPSPPVAMRKTYKMVVWQGEGEMVAAFLTASSSPSSPSAPLILPLARSFSIINGDAIGGRTGLKVGELQS